MKLVIVESPTKSKTISRFLSSDYQTASSYGHIRDLPKGSLGINIEKNFQPKYVIPTRARKIVNQLKKLSGGAEKVILASDEDREGEAIAWHLTYALGLKNPDRIVFHEITEQAIKNALKNPRKIDKNLVDAQQARRLLDRLVGYKLSPFLWKKLIRGLSAGRVQSAAMRLICQREKEISEFKPEEYWTIVAAFLKVKNQISKIKNEKNLFQAILTKRNGQLIPKLKIKNKGEADKILKDLEGADYKVVNIEKKQTKRNPLPPFTTSTLQQTAFRYFGFSAKKTMALAQRLYEHGLITYHRTDSLNLSKQSIVGARELIESQYGKQYLPVSVKYYKTKSKSAQEAHEAIRPAYVNKKAEQLKLEPAQKKLYALIWQRFTASQMKEALVNSLTVEIQAKNYTFKSTGQSIAFDGFLKVYPMKLEEKTLPALNEGEMLALEKLLPDQHFTKPPARYSEAGLVKTLEKEGVGRPSTYAVIIDTIQKRNYVEKNDEKRLQPTEIGAMVNDLLVKHFPKIVDIKFTAKIEKELDEIAQGKDSLLKTLQDFYAPFEKNLKEKEKQVKKQMPAQETNKTCPDCKKPLVIRMGRFGKFLACSGFPQCKHTETLPQESLGIKCPECLGRITEKRTKKGKLFYGCENWPKCEFALWDKPAVEKDGVVKLCEKCHSPMIEKNKKIKCSNKKCPLSKNAPANRDNRS